MIENDKLFYQTVKAFEKDKRNIKNDAIVFIKDKGLIWTHGTFFSGGSGGGGGGGGDDQKPIELNMPLMYYKFTEKDQEFPSDISSYSKTYQLTATDITETKGTTQIALENEFVLIVVPSELIFIGAKTSNNEKLDIDENFTKHEGLFDDYIGYEYSPVIAPEDLTLTLTFEIA